MSISFYQKKLKEMTNFTQQKHFNFYSYKYHRMGILTLIYLSILARNFLQHKYDTNENLKIYILFLAPVLFLIQWIIDKCVIQKSRVIDFSPIIILYFLIPYVIICEGKSWTFDTLSQSILLIWSINIIFSKSIFIGFIGFLIGLPALIYQGWNQDYQEIIIGVGLFSLFMNWELERQNKERESQIKLISQKVENKHLQAQKQLKMIIEVDRNFYSANQTSNDVRLIYCSNTNRMEQYFGSIDPLTFIRNCYISSKKKKSFIQELINQLTQKNSDPSNFKVRYLKGINAIIINASHTDSEELEMIDKSMFEQKPSSKSLLRFSKNPYSPKVNNLLNQPLKFTLLISQEYEERQYWKHFQKYQQKLLQSILRKSMSNMQKIINILSPNCRRSKAFTLIETKQIINKLKYIATVMQQDFFNLYDFQKQNYDTNPVDFSIKKIIKETIDIYSELCQEKQINLIFFDKAPEIKKIKNDEKRILQILMILLENSIASSGLNSNVLIKLKCEDINSPYAILEVVDTGTGILNTFQPPFPNPKTLQQAQHNSQNPIQIGLYNLKQILSKIGPPQDLILKSTKDVGTKISFKLYRDLEYKDQVYLGEQQNVNRYSTPVLPTVDDKPFSRQEKQYRSMIPIQNDNQIQEESYQISDESFYGKNKKCKSEESSPTRQSDYYKRGSHNNLNVHSSLTNIHIDETCSKLKSNNTSPRKHYTQLSIQLHNSCFTSYSIQEKPDHSHSKRVSILEGQLSPSKTNNSDSSPNNSNYDKDKIQKSILKRPKKLRDQSENFINLNKVINNDEFEQDSDLDSDIFAIEIEEFPNHSREKTQPFDFIKRTQKEKRLSHISDISRILSPQNMPSTNAFSNSRIGNETSPKRLITRQQGRNSTLNFTEIEKDF